MQQSKLSYTDIHRQSIEQPERFWAEAAKQIEWDTAPTQILDSSKAPFYHWYPDGELNTCFNALDRHVRDGHGEKAAIIYDSPVTNTTRQLSYAQLLDQTARFAGVLKTLGVSHGDRVVIYMPMVPEALVAMLACARIGAIHSVVFGGFAAKELATRIDDAKPKVVVSASCGIEINRTIEYKPLLDKALTLSGHQVDHTVILQRPQAKATLQASRDYDWETELAKAAPVECVSVQANDPLYILYTSGTTGKPKGVIRDTGGHAVAMQLSMQYLYDTSPEDVFWCASDIGWVVGHSYICYAPLILGCTTVVYEGKPVGTPDAGAFWRVVQDHQVNILFTAPTALRAIKREDAKGELLKQYDISTLRALYLAGERSDPDSLEWIERLLSLPVVDHWWQTETGWGIAGNPLGYEPQTIKYGSATLPMPGYDIHILNAEGKPLAAGEMGNICLKLPLPPGCLPTLWQDDARFLKSYMSMYPGYYVSGDSGYLDEDGYVWVMGRIDDVINCAGHRLSTGGMEEVLAAHPDVAECAVIGPADTFKGQIPIGLVVLKSNTDASHQDIIDKLIQSIRDEVGAIASFKQVVVVKRLPKTRSGKILRGIIKKIADNEPYTPPATIDDPVILDEIKAALQTLDYAN